MRLIVQSLETGRFLAPSMSDGEPEWVRSLADAGGGIVDDKERADQLVRDWADLDDKPVIVDLDVLGTANDLPAEQSNFVTGTSEGNA